MKKWIEQIENLGKAMIEIELVSQDYPILFVASVGSQRYLVETLDYEEGVYLMSSTTERRLLNMLNGTRDIYSAVSEGRKKYYVTYNYDSGKYIAKRIGADDVDEDDMPDKNIFYTVNTSVVSEYKQYLAKAISDMGYKKRSDDILSLTIEVGVKDKHNAVSTEIIEKKPFKRKNRVGFVYFNDYRPTDNVNVCLMG